MLQSHDWPGNVRQLRNNIERLLILATGDPKDVVTADMLPAEVAAPGSGGGLRPEQIIALPLAKPARCSSGSTSAPRSSFRRQHLAHGRLHRHGALRAAPEAEVPGRGLGPRR
jgi:DNA-binding NtrC family response regulator